MIYFSFNFVPRSISIKVVLEFSTSEKEHWKSVPQMQLNWWLRPSNKPSHWALTGSTCQVSCTAHSPVPHFHNLWKTSGVKQKLSCVSLFPIPTHGDEIQNALASLFWPGWHGLPSVATWFYKKGIHLPHCCNLWGSILWKAWINAGFTVSLTQPVSPSAFPTACGKWARGSLFAVKFISSKSDSHIPSWLICM